MVELLDREEAKIQKSQDMMNSSTTPSFIQGHLSFLPATIKKLEKNGLPLSAMDLLNSVKGELDTIPGVKGDCIHPKV